jgi:hypothetical protein
MVGRPAVDRLGRTPPAFVTRARAIEWTEHPREAKVDLVAARRWYGDRWVVLTSAPMPVKVSAGTEGTLTVEFTDVRLAVVEITPGLPGAEPTFRRLARTVSPFLYRTGWEVLPERMQPTTACTDRCQIPGEPEGLIDDAEINALDFAPYTLAPGDRAFGVRVMLHEGYGGGFASFESLALLRMNGDTLVPVLEVPVGMVSMIAGNWSRSGGRERETMQADLVVMVRPRKNAVADLLLKPTLSRRTLRFRWSEQQGVYTCTE